MPAVAGSPTLPMPPQDEVSQPAQQCQDVFPFSTPPPPNPNRFQTIEDSAAAIVYDRYTAEDAHLLREKRGKFVSHMPFYQCQIHLLPTATLIFVTSGQRGHQKARGTQ